MKRVCILGSSGAGKSTLTRQLAAILNIEALHLDTYFWKANWTEPDQEDWHKIHKELAQRESWIIDGNFSATWDDRIPRADTLIYIDLPRWRCIYGALKRLATYYGRTRPDLPEACPESFDWEFLKFIWNYPRRGRPKTLKLLEDMKGKKTIYHFKSRAEIRRFLKQLESNTCN